MAPGSSHNSRFPRSLRSVVGSRHSASFWPNRGGLSVLHAKLNESNWLRISMILARLFQKHSPAKAFKLYIQENPWALEAKLFDV